MKYLIIDKRPKIEPKEQYPYAVKRIIEELQLKNVSWDFCHFDQIEIIYKDNKVEFLFNSKKLTEYSHIIFRGHSLGNPLEYETKYLMCNYIEQLLSSIDSVEPRVQNRQALIMTPYYDKLFTAQLCIQNSIPYLSTHYMVNGKYTVKHTSSLFQLPYICKIISGENDVRDINNSKKIKKNVFKIETEEDLRQEFLNDKDKTQFFLQQFADSGEDMRLFVQKGKVIAGWKRRATQGFMTVNKGEYTMYNDPIQADKELAEKVAKVFKADFMAVDLMYHQGKPYLQEISFHPGFKAYETKIDGEPVNIAKAIVEAF